MVFKRTGFIQSRELLRQRSATESRRDGILLTVDFNLRNVKALHATSLQSPAGTILYLPIVPSLRDFAAYSSCWLFRRLKSTVNKVPSLRNFNSLFWINPVRLKTMICFLFFIPWLQKKTFF